MRISSNAVMMSFALIAFGASISAQSPTYHVGRTPTPDEIKAWDISISPDGHELPPGHGTAKEGRDLFIEKGCVQCHGRNGEGGRAPTLSLPSKQPHSHIAGRILRALQAGLQLLPFIGQKLHVF